MTESVGSVWTRLPVIGNLDGIVQIVQGTWDKVAGGQTFPPFDFWRSSRMLPYQENFDPSPLAFWVPDKLANAPDLSSHITEFPFFTFLFADLHAHMMVIPFTLLVIGLGLSLVVGLRDRDRAWPLTAGILGLGFAGARARRRTRPWVRSPLRFRPRERT